MDTTKEMLEELKCIQCEKYLTCGPIYIRNTSGEAICGRCTAFEDAPVTRNKQYEIVARTLLFPCVHAANGCKEKLQFSDNKYNIHEQNCTYRDRICPVSKSGECEWIGPWTTLVEHCRKEHQNNIFNSPCTLQHDITAECLNAYILTAFDLLFILHVKVCVSTAKIYHSLRYLGNPKKASNFKYKLDVERNDVVLSKPGKVSPAGILTIQINSCLELCVNSLLSFLGGYDGTTFTVTVQRVEKSVAKKNETTTTTTKSGKELKKNGKQSQCARKFNGCVYKETEGKCVMHERYYCPYLTSCFLCNKQTNIGQIHGHYLKEHSVDTHQIGCMFRVHPANVTMLWKYCLISSTFGTLVCWYTFNEVHFEMELITPMPSDQLDKYQCLIHVINPKSKREKTFILPRSTNSNSDWSIQIARANVTSNDKKFDIAVLLTQI